MITKLSHTTVYVLDIAKAHEVYVNKLGFKIKTDFVMQNGFRWLTIAPADQPDLEIVLYEITPGMLGEEKAQLLKSLAEMNGLGGGVFEADDCQKTYDELVAKGIEFMQPPTKQFYGVEALFRDGCGNWFSLTHRTPFQK
jgi:catechol 2,3-dioxygenase-like lactoylglutathione lyase family enzyme